MCNYSMFRTSRLFTTKLNCAAQTCPFINGWYLLRPSLYLYIFKLSSPLLPCSWFVTMQICVVSFQSWRNALGLLLRELRPWRLHWGMQRKAPWWTAGGISRRWTASRTPWGQRTQWGAPMQHRSVQHCCLAMVIFSKMSAHLLSAISQ